MNEINEIKLDLRFINMLNHYKYRNENECDVIQLLFNIIYNLTELFIDNLAEIFDEIKKMNKLIDEANLEEEIKKKKKHFRLIIKNNKTKIKEIKENPNGDSKK